MSLRDWHLGQLIVVWGGGIGLEWVLYWLMFEADIEPIPIIPLRFAWAMAILIGILALPLGLCMITWEWGRSRPRPKDK